MLTFVISCGVSFAIGFLAGEIMTRFWLPSRAELIQSWQAIAGREEDLRDWETRLRTTENSRKSEVAALRLQVKSLRQEVENYQHHFGGIHNVNRN